MQDTITNQVIRQGSASRLGSDYNNCTVLALAATTGISYDEAYKIAEVSWNRKKKKGVRSSILSNYFSSVTMSEKVDTKKVYHVKRDNRDVVCKMTVGTFAKEYPKGNYFLIVSGHALAINDGKVLDHQHLLSKPKRIIKHAWKIK
jgi:hypothetical protein